MQVLYLGRAPRTNETLLDFHEKCRVTRHSQVFRGLTGSERIPGRWGVTVIVQNFLTKFLLRRGECKTRENSNFLKKCKTVISIKKPKIFLDLRC